MCPHCRAFITVQDKICPYCHEAVGPRAVDQRNPSPIGGFIPQARFNTVLILAINFGLYLITVLYSMNAGRGDLMNLDAYTLIDFGAMFSPLIRSGEWWRLVTAGFLHGGLIHILVNSWGLFDLGAQVEEVFGASRMLTFYFISSVSGFYVSSLLKTGPSIGASAALCGLIGALIAHGLRDRGAYGAAIRSVAVRWIVYIVIFSLLPGVDMAAHMGGLAGGFGLAYFSGDPKRINPVADKLWRFCAGCCILLTVASFLMMYLWFSHHAQ